MAAMEQAAERAVPGAGEAWRYMIKLGLYDSQPSEHKLQGSFTTYLSIYRCPFLFTQWADDASSVFTVIHEFGHFLSYYTNPEGTYYAPEELDLAETDAQGFELLMLSQYDVLFGRYATAARLCWLMNALYAILSGFIMAFTLSLDDYVISLFLSGPKFETLPVFIFGLARKSVPPTIYALSTLFLVMVLGLLIFSNIMQARMEKKSML